MGGAEIAWHGTVCDWRLRYPHFGFFDSASTTERTKIVGTLCQGVADAIGAAATCFGRIISV
jgi:hypothetical protein